MNEIDWKNDGQLDGADENLAAAVAAGGTIREAAERGNCSESTVRCRLREKEFQARVAQLRAEMIEAALGKMSDSMSDAVTALRRLLSSESESIQLGAARTILESTIRMRDSISFERRLAALEEREEA